MNTQIEAFTRHLPADLPREAERIGYRILSALDRLGFSHVNRDGSVFTVRFSEAALLGDELALYSVDLERLWHFRAGDLAHPQVVSHLAMTLKKPVKVNTVNGLMYVVKLKETPQTRLPARVELELDKRPAGEWLVPIGKTRQGDLWRPLPELGHCLITGTSGSGKSTWLHASLAALLTAACPDKLQIVLIDPKRSELAPWRQAPHVVGAVAHSLEQATAALANLVNEIDRRGDLLAGVGARDLRNYNLRAETPLPFILCVIDECLDLALMAGARSELANYLKTIAIRGRSAGVCLWAATQHAAAVTGLPRVVNVNLTTRLVFRVADQSAASVAGCPGAEKIDRSKPGRLLAKIDAAPIEAQGYYLPDEQLSAIARGVAGTGSGPSLTPSEQALVLYAVSHLNGQFIIGKLASAHLDGWTKYRIEQLGKTWERRGWLTRPQHATDARRVTPELAQLAGLTEHQAARG